MTFKDALSKLIHNTDVEEIIKERFQIADSVQSRFIEITDFVNIPEGRIVINRYLTDDYYYISMDGDGIYLNWE